MLLFHSLSSMNVKRVGVRDCLRACVLRVFDFFRWLRHMLFVPLMRWEIKKAELKFRLELSGWRDLNPRPLRPERSALPSCATARFATVGNITRLLT